VRAFRVRVLRVRALSVRVLRARALRVRVLRISNDLKNGICKTCQIFDYVAAKKHWILF